MRDRSNNLVAKDTSRRTLPDRVAYVVAASVIGLGLFASLTPSPLYRSYSVLWSFSPLTLTLIYATYALGVLAALLLAGSVSDEVGRRPVLLVALGMLMASTVVFMLADSAAWLFVARGLQGLATGAALSAASAALLDLHPRRDPASVGLTNATAAASGVGLGVLVSSSLVQLGIEPRVLPYVVLLTLFALAFAGAYWMREPVLERGRLRLTIERPSIPPVVRRPFVLSSTRRSRLVVDRRALLLARSPARGAALRHHQRDRRRHRHRGARSVGRGCAAPDCTHGAVGRNVSRLGGARRRNDPDRRRRRDRVTPTCIWREPSSAGGLRRRVPRRAARTRRVDTSRAPRRCHVRVLRRRLRVAVSTRRPRGDRGHLHRSRVDLRDLRRCRRRDRADRRLRGLAHSPGPRRRASRGGGSGARSIVMNARQDDQVQVPELVQPIAAGGGLAVGALEQLAAARALRASGGGWNEARASR